MLPCLSTVWMTQLEQRSLAPAARPRAEMPQPSAGSGGSQTPRPSPSTLLSVYTTTTHHTLTHEEPINPALGYQEQVGWFATQSMLAWKDFLELLVEEHPGNRVVFSCRALDYSAPLSTPRLRVPQIVIEPMTLMSWDFRKRMGEAG